MGVAKYIKNEKDEVQDVILQSGIHVKPVYTKIDLEEKLRALRQNLMSDLTKQFDREMRRGTQRIEDTVAPFGRFVRAENDKIESQREQLVELEAHTLGLQAQLKAVDSKPQ